MADTPVGGTVIIEGDELLRVFEAAVGETYGISVSTEGYRWEIEEGLESLTAELTDETLRFEEMRIL
ncbi:hypothetical protein [Halorussus sp. MSC15.2]|uniref:hypothetical protein n=1 Tax=Halorussus sp. MSC15.2 TaxID=2283638 RepID=UPI0013D8D932|nr:hypothetical protein [Halorussus sp. MSC15.2]NEU56953.1 hypothetical protein [Halorussus sp. MSC15.2]